MKKLYKLTLLFLLCALHVSGQYVTIWKTDNPGISESDQITIPASGGSYYISWTDINNSSISGAAVGSGYYTLRFPNPGTYRVIIFSYGEPFTGITFGPGSDAQKLIEITQWGDVSWGSMENAYAECTNLTVTATDIPNLQNVTSMAGMFSGCSLLADVPGIENWNVSTVTNMQSIFANTALFNGAIGNWDVSSVTNMSSMFQNAASFNQPIGSWEVGSVTNMSTMFKDAISFDQPINDWDVSQVTDMSSMFSFCIYFDQPIADWDVSNVITMHRMFEGTQLFNRPIGSWDVTSVYDLSYLFAFSSGFNKSLNDWDVSNVTNMYATFYSSNFNQPLNKWNVSNSHNLSFMLAASSANFSLGEWTIAPGATMDYMVWFSAMDCANLALTLKGWAANPATPDNLIFGADGINYGLQAATALQTLRTIKNWTVTIGDAVICAPLEVSLVSFTAKSTDGTVQLEWSTASETDNDYFDVERSADARSWNAVGRIKGAGTVNTERNYSLTDTNPLEGNSYYRLKIVDLSGKADYSNIRAVNVKTGAAPSIYPNPATTSLTLSGKVNGAVKIYNLSGQQVFQTEAKTEKTQIQLNGLPSGAYIIKSNDGWNSQFIKN